MISKTPSKVKKENKKPPKTKKSFQKEEDRPDIIQDIESKMLEGQEHINVNNKEKMEQTKEEIKKNK